MLLRGSVLSLAAASLLFAAGAQGATFTLADLVAGGGTSSFTSDDGQLTFSNFEVTRTKNLSDDLSQYTITTTSDGFVLTSSEFDAQAGGLRKLDFSYTVTASSPIVQAALEMEGSRTTGRAKVEKDLELSGDEEGGTFLLTYMTAAGSSLSDSDEFSPGATSIDVDAQVRIKKVSSITSITDRYQVVPEPGTLALVSAGMAGLFLLGRRRNLV